MINKTKNTIKSLDQESLEQQSLDQKTLYRQEKDTSKLQLLAEAGLLAATHGQLEQAGKIFNYLLTVRPDTFVTDFGFALIALQKKQFSVAIERLQRHSANEQMADYANAFLALVFFLNNEPESGLTCGKKASTSNNNTAARLGQAMVGQIETLGSNNHEY